MEYSVTVSSGKFSSIFLPGLHVLIDPVLFTTYIWSLLGKVMIYLQIGRMRLICRRLCPSKLCALKWTRLFAEFIRSFLRLRRTPDFGQLWHVNPSAFILSEMIWWPHAVHTDMTDWLTLLPYYPVSQLCLKGSEPSFQIRGVTTSVNFNLQTSYRNWSSPWFWTTQPRNKFPNWSLASHSFPLGSFSKCLT